MSLNYCTVDDLLYKDKLQYPYFTGITVSTPIRGHNITGWKSLCGIMPDGRECRLFDIWLGFNHEKLDQLLLTLGEFSKKTYQTGYGVG